MKIINTSIVCLLLLPIWQNTYGQAHLDSLCIGKTINSINNGEEVLKRGVAYLKNREFSLADSSFNRCICFSRQKGLLELSAKCMKAKGNVNIHLGNYFEATIWFKEAISLSKKLNNRLTISESVMNLTLAYKKLNLYDSALKYAYDGIALLEVAQPGSINLMKGYNILGNLLKMSGGDHSDAHVYYNKSLKIAFSLSDSTQIGKLYNNLGDWHRKRNHMDSAFYYYKLNLSIKEKFADKLSLSNSYYNIGEAYFDIAEYTASIDHINQSIQLREEVADIPGLMHSYALLSKAYLANGQLKKANDQLLHFAEFTKGKNVPKQIMSNYLHTKSSVLVKEGKYKAAIKTQEQLLKLNEEIYANEKQRFVTEYEERFKKDQREREIKKQKERAEIAEEKKDYEGKIAVRNYIILMLLIIIMCASFFTWYNRKSKEAAKNKTYYKDANHRHSNQLTLLDNVIEIKSNATKDSNTRHILENIRGTIDAINNINLQLYQSDEKEVAYLDFRKLVNSLINNVVRASATNNSEAVINKNLNEVHLIEYQAKPLALIANEVLTNANKYGKSQDGTLKLDVNLSELDNLVKLTIADHGHSLNESKPQPKSGFGKGIIHELAEFELNANYDYSSTPKGTMFSIEFNKKGGV